MLVNFKNLMRLLPKSWSIVEAAGYASYVYGHYDIDHKNTVVSSLPRFASKIIPTKTSLHMVCYIDSDRPLSYQTIAIRGTVGISDHFGDSIQHAYKLNGITEYQMDAYNTLMDYLLVDSQSLPVVLTGHSMGAKIIDMFLAQLYVDRFSDCVKKKRHSIEVMSRIKAIYCFDSPGTYPMLRGYFQSVFTDKIEQHLKDFLLIRSKVVTEVVGHPNSVNMCHQHAGEVYFLPNYDGVSAQKLYNLLQGDYTSELMQKHSIDSIAKAVILKQPLVRVLRWGGVSELYQADSVRRFNNFALSYHEYCESLAVKQPTLRNNVFAWCLSKVLSNVRRDRLDASHPVMQAAKDADYFMSGGLLFWLYDIMQKRIKSSYNWVSKSISSKRLSSGSNQQLARMTKSSVHPKTPSMQVPGD